MKLGSFMPEPDDAYTLRLPTLAKRLENTAFAEPSWLAPPYGAGEHLRGRGSVGGVQTHQSDRQGTRDRAGRRPDPGRIKCHPRLPGRRIPIAANGPLRPRQGASVAALRAGKHRVRYWRAAPLDSYRQAVAAQPRSCRGQARCRTTQSCDPGERTDR